MIKIENTEVVGWEHVIRGMRNPMNSWDKSDSYIQFHDEYAIGANDLELMMKLAKGGPVHAKYRRMITVYLDIAAPLYWWKEFDTYKVGTVANSCSTKHKIHEKEFELEDFSCEHLWGNETIDAPENEVDTDCLIEPQIPDTEYYGVGGILPFDVLNVTMQMLNKARELFLKTNDKQYWWQMIQLLPSSYNQKRTIMLNYEVLVGIYKHRKEHKLDEWREFCEWIKTLPYSELITGNILTSSQQKEEF